ncbi:hypothetical protein ACFONC_11150 [Luteimonas soli]|uniref:Uncharacterized protein n=1 Tax=Luteimonas soli TaxID=1648966 RepID=A0ABV7XLH0_9GAMM
MPRGPANAASTPASPHAAGVVAMRALPGHHGVAIRDRRPASSEALTDA